jgi:hypothetical protein
MICAKAMGQFGTYREAADAFCAHAGRDHAGRDYRARYAEYLRIAAALKALYRAARACPREILTVDSA